MSTPNLELPTSPSGPSNLSVAYNDAMQRLDALVPLIVIDHALNDPPTTVSGDEGKRWIVGGTPTGVWIGHTNDVALCVGPDLWKYLTPHNGWRGKSLADGLYYSFDGSAWVADSGVSVAFGEISGSPSDNTALATELSNKLEASDITGKADTSYVDLAVSTLQGLNDQTGTAYTLAATDAGKEVRCTNAAAITFNIDTQANVDTPDMAMVVVSQGGAGAVTVVGLTGVTLRSPNGASTSALGDARIVQHISGDEWRVW